MTHIIDVPQLVGRYQEGDSAAALARELGVDVSAVNRRLSRAGVQIRGRAGATAANLVRNPSLRSRMGRPRKYPVNPAFFDILTEDVAYVVGLMQADGSNQVERGTVCITLKASDAGLLDEVARTMGAVRPLTTDQHGAKRFLVQSHDLSDGLARWGVVSPKTHTASTHTGLLGNRDYWRGVVDGDGSLCVGADGRRFLTLVGARPVCDQFLAFARIHGTGARVSVRPHKRIWSVHLSGQAAVVLACVLYHGAGLALERKRNVARAWGCLDQEVTA